MTRKIAGYEILEPLPSRFHYRARSTDGETVALQVLPAWRRSEESMARFERELALEKAAQHENLARFIACGSVVLEDEELVGSAADGEVFYIVREAVSGTTLEELLRGGLPPLALSISVAIQAARGLGALHEAGIVHRNLRPSTLALREDGVLKLIDFGLVKLLREEAAADDVFRTGVGQVVGAAGYMAPEQLAGDAVDARTDLFALGCVLYELVTGARPFGGDDLLDYFRRVREDEPEPLASGREGVPGSLARIIGQLLQKDRAARYASATEVESELIESLGDPDV